MPPDHSLSLDNDAIDVALRISESRYRRLFEAAQDGILLLNADTAQIEDVNPYLIEMLGYSHAEFLGKKLWEVGAFTDRPESKEMFATLQATGYVRYENLPLKTKAGGNVDVEFVSNSYDCEGIKVIQCNIRNITERTVAEAKALRHTHLYAALSQCNRAVAHCGSEEELFLQVCRAAVQFGGMKMAWVGLVDREAGMVIPVASFGDDNAYLKDIKISVDVGNPLGLGPTGSAIREDQPCWRQDLLADPSTAPWHERARRAGFAASASLPLHHQGRVIGALTLYVTEANSFDEFARNLLDEMAADISFALDNFTREVERQRAQEEIKYKNTILQTQLETSLDAILVVDENGKITSYNQNFIDLWRLSPQLVAARVDAPVLQAVVEQVVNSEAFAARVQYLVEHRDDKSYDEIPLIDGRIIDRYSSPATGVDGKYYGRVWYFRDITGRKQAELRLLESQRRFADLLGNVELVSIMLDREARITYCNDYLLRLTGWRYAEVIGKNWWDLFVPPEIHELKGEFFAALLDNNPEALHHENDIVTRSGERRLIRWNNSVLRSETGDVIGMASIGEDITERKQSEARIVYLNRVLSMLSSINTLIVRAHDRDELYGESCNIAVDTGGFRMAMLCMVDLPTMKIVPVASAGKDEELVGKIKDRLSLSKDSSNTMVGLAIKEKQAIVSNDSMNDPRLAFGKEYAESGIRSLVVIPLLISDEAVGTISLYASEIDFFHEEELKLLTELAGDISFAIDHLDKQERLNYLAYYDVLTGLANRKLFLDRVTQYIRVAAKDDHKLALLLIDLERFKNINDTLGRNAGDVLLKQVAEWLILNFGGEDLLARIDADHFAVLVPEVKQVGDISKLLENKSQAFADHSFRLNDAVFRIAAKAGIALFPDDGADADTLFRNAEAALKKAKASGDKYLFYTQKMTEAMAGKLALENQMRQAIENDEFVLYYQPKVNLVSGMVTSAEALIRWNDPKTGLVPPGKFIPILEETGLIYEVGRWALRKAMSDYQRWRAAGLPAVRIAVNVSPLQLRNVNFVDEIRQVIAVDAHAAAGLELEITESLIMENVQYSIDTLKKIRGLGITIAIDDFGTGFSSLSYLAKLPVDTLKIDRSFVIEMDAPQGFALVSTIILVAHALKLKVVAEGVETERQSRQLLSLGCDEMQGFLFSKPVSAEIFETKFLTSSLLG